MQQPSGGPKLIIILGLAIAALGLLYQYYPKAFTWLGRLPGDIRYESGGTKVFFPIATCIVITLIINVILYLLRKF